MYQNLQISAPLNLKYKREKPQTLNLQQNQSGKAVPITGKKKKKKKKKKNYLA